MQIYAAMIEGSFGSSRKIWITLQKTAMLLCIALAVTPALKMRFWNIGAEGQVLMGALATAGCIIAWGDKLPLARAHPDHGGLCRGRGHGLDGDPRDLPRALGHERDALYPDDELRRNAAGLLCDHLLGEPRGLQHRWHHQLRDLRRVAALAVRAEVPWSTSSWSCC